MTAQQRITEHSERCRAAIALNKPSAAMRSGMEVFEAYDSEKTEGLRMNFQKIYKLAPT
jgi:hypothetical protein